MVRNIPPHPLRSCLCKIPTSINRCEESRTRSGTVPKANWGTKHWILVTWHDTILFLLFSIQMALKVSSVEIFYNDHGIHPNQSRSCSSNHTRLWEASARWKPNATPHECWTSDWQRHQFNCGRQVRRSKGHLHQMLYKIAKGFEVFEGEVP